MNLLEFLHDCDQNPNIEYTHANSFIILKFFSAWSRFPDHRTDKMQDFLNHVNHYNP